MRQRLCDVLWKAASTLFGRGGADSNCIPAGLSYPFIATFILRNFAEINGLNPDDKADMRAVKKMLREKYCAKVVGPTVLIKELTEMFEKADAAREEQFAREHDELMDRDRDLEEYEQDEIRKLRRRLDANL